MEHSKPFDQPMPPERCWIKFQLNLRGIKHKEIAQKAKTTEAFISLVICGRRKSKNVESVLAEVLGYPSFKALWADAFISTRKAG